MSADPLHSPLPHGLSTPSAEHSQNIWLAGLGALARAQAEGSKAFDALVKQGMALQNQTQALAKEQLAEAAQRMEAMTTSANPVTAGRWNALESIFEQRVARAIERLGLPDAATVAQLHARIVALEQALAITQTPAPGAPPATHPRAAAKPPQKTRGKVSAKAAARPLAHAAPKSRAKGA